MDDKKKLSVTRHGVTDDIIREATRYTKCVLIDSDCRPFGTRAHKKPIKKRGQWGVRSGRRGTGFNPLLSCRKIDAGNGVVIYSFKI